MLHKAIGMKTYIVSKHRRNHLIYNQRNDMVEVIYDEITVRGKVARYGILTIDNEQTVIGLGNIVSENGVLGTV